MNFRLCDEDDENNNTDIKASRQGLSLYNGGLYRSLPFGADARTLTPKHYAKLCIHNYNLFFKSTHDDARIASPSSRVIEINLSANCLCLILVVVVNPCTKKDRINIYVNIHK